MYIRVAILLSPDVASADQSEALLRPCTVDSWLHPLIVVRLLLLTYFRSHLSCSAASLHHFQSSAVHDRRLIVSFCKP